ERGFEFLHRTYFDFDWLRAAAVAEGTLQRRRNSACESDVIILDENSVGKIEAVILSATAADGILVDHAQAGSSLAGIEDARFRAGDRFHELAGQSGDAAHALQKIQDDALTRENHAPIVANHGDGLTFVKTHAIENFGMGGDFVVRSDSAIEGGVDIEDAGNYTDAGENAIFLGEDGGRGALIGIDAGVAGGVARGPVFEQRVFDDRGDASTVKVHDYGSQLPVLSSQFPRWVRGRSGCPTDGLIFRAGRLILLLDGASHRPLFPEPWPGIVRCLIAADCSRILFLSSPVLCSSVRARRRRRFFVRSEVRHRILRRCGSPRKLASTWIQVQNCSHLPVCLTADVYQSSQRRAEPGQGGHGPLFQLSLFPSRPP